MHRAHKPCALGPRVKSDPCKICQYLMAQHLLCGSYVPTSMRPVCAYNARRMFEFEMIIPVGQGSDAFGGPS